MAFLSGWTKRRKVTVSNTNIDSNLTHFPLLLTLGTSVGTGNTDVSSIFDELTSDANRTKIAFTKTDGTTQLYAEIEKWDDANETAVIWISKSDLVLASGATTDVYMYYDSAQSANTTYIGDTNATVAENVWDSNFKMVQHMADGASTSATYDSTSNDNDGAKSGAAQPTQVAGEIGESQDFEDTNAEYITVAEDSSLDVGASVDFTIGFWVKSSTNETQAVYYKYTDTDGYLVLFRKTTGIAQVTIRDGATALSTQGATDLTDGNWHYVVCVVDRDVEARIYVAGIEESSYAQQPNITGIATGDLSNAVASIIGSDSRDPGNVDLNLDGGLDELRVSIGIARSAAWIKANYYAQTDALVAWGAEEENPGDADVLVSEQALALTLQSPTINFDYTVFLSEQKLALTQPSLEVIIGQVFLAQVFQLGLEQQSPTLKYDYALALSELGLELAQPTPTFAISITEVLTALGLELDQVSPTIGLDFCAEPDALKLGVSLYDPILFYWQKQTKHTATWTNSAQSSAPTWVNKTMH